MDLNELLEVWKNYLSRRQWEQTLADAEASGDEAGTQDARQALGKLPEISHLEALKANAEMVNVLSVQRFIAMKAAREQGLSLEQIGNALGVSRQSAWEFFQRKLAAQKPPPPSSDASQSGKESSQ
jgi:hypothetical protein